MTDYVTIKQLQTLSREDLEALVAPHLDRSLADNRNVVPAAGADRAKLLDDIYGFVHGTYALAPIVALAAPGPASADAMSPCLAASIEFGGALLAFIVQAIMAGVDIDDLPAAVRYSVDTVWGEGDGSAYRAAIVAVVKDAWASGSDLEKGKAILTCVVKFFQFFSLSAIIHGIQKEVHWYDVLIIGSVLGVQIAALVVSDGAAELVEVVALLPGAFNLIASIDEFIKAC